MMNKSLFYKKQHLTISQMKAMLFFKDMSMFHKVLKLCHHTHHQCLERPSEQFLRSATDTVLLKPTTSVELATFVKVGLKCAVGTSVPLS